MYASAALSRLSRSPGDGPAAKELRRWAVGAGDAARAAGVGVVGVCVCWKGPSWLPRCSAPGNRPPDPGTRAGEAALREAWPLLVSSGPFQSPVPLESPSAWSGPWRTSGPGSGASGHAASEREKIQIGDDNVTGFETTTGGLCIQSEPCQRRGTVGESPEETSDEETSSTLLRPALPLLVALSPCLPLCLPQILAIMGR